MAALLMGASLCQAQVGTASAGSTVLASEQFVNVLSQGAVGDGQAATDCSMTGGSTVLSCVGPHFTSANVGQVIAVYGAGATVNGFVEPLASTILSYQSGEDRAAKHAFRKLAGDGGFREESAKPRQPSAQEIAENPRARSAKLRSLVRN